MKMINHDPRGRYFLGTSWITVYAGGLREVKDPNEKKETLGER
jgi:hypothetical protein